MYGRVSQAHFSKTRRKKSLDVSLRVYLRKLMHRTPSRESARKPRENIETLNMDSRSRLSSIKLMEETDVSVQIYSFLEVTAVRYDEKPEKDVQRCDIRDIVTRRNVLCLTVRLNQSASGTIDCTIYMFPRYLKPFPRKSMT